MTDFFSKCDQIRSFLQIWSHLLTKSVMENFVFCAKFPADRSHLLKKPLMENFIFCAVIYLQCI